MQASIRWLSHACFSIQSKEGKVLFIDPWIKDNHLCPIKLEDVKEADFILVTHDHNDHMADTVAISQKTGAMVVGQPETVGRFQTELGLDSEKVVNSGFGMNIGGCISLGGIKVVMTEALHSSNTGTASGYIITLEDGKNIYHAGDTGIFCNMRLLGELYRIEVALLPIGSCFTMDAFQAAEALRLLKPRVVIPMHFKTFPFLLQEPQEFFSLVKEKAPEVKIVHLEPGQSYSLK